MRTYSYSRISTYLRCPRLARFRYVEKTPPESVSIALPLGSAIHDAVAYSVHRPDASTEELNKMLQDVFLSRIDATDAPVNFKGKTLEETYDQAEGMFNAYLKQPITGVKSTEQHFEIPVGDLRLEGFIDFITKDEIVELKTAARSYSQMQVDLNLQATCYAAAVMNGEPVRVRFLVLTKTKVPKVQSITTWRSKEDVTILESVTRHVDSGFQKGVFPRNISVQTCSGCEFKEKCLN
jgi:CRISPR/Cas system-associated exonuclease Cas4 (RecB family)